MLRGSKRIQEKYKNSKDITIDQILREEIPEMVISGIPLNHYVGAIKEFINLRNMCFDKSINLPSENNNTGRVAIQDFVSSINLSTLSYIMFRRSYLGRGDLITFRGPLPCEKGVPQELFDVIDEYHSIPVNKIVDIQLYLKIDNNSKVVMIDDINMENLLKMYQCGFNPSAVVRTSLDNYQVWFLIDDEDGTLYNHYGELNNLKDYICVLLSIWFHGDILFRNYDPGGYGRLPEVINTKKKYLEKNGEFEKSKLVYVQDKDYRCQTFNKFVKFFRQDGCIFKKTFESEFRNRIDMMRENNIDVDIFYTEHDIFEGMTSK